jgi:hypothetical protein
VPGDVRQERGWRCLKLQGPLPLNMTGVLAAVLEPLAAAQVAIFAIATFDTDYVLVRETHSNRRSWRSASGHQVAEPAGHSIERSRSLALVEAVVGPRGARRPMLRDRDAERLGGGFAREHVFGRALGRDAPVVEQQQALGPGCGALQVVHHRQNRHAARADLVEHPEQLQLVADVEVRGGSSSSRASGSCASPRASDASWRSPAESRLSGRRDRCAMPVSSKARAMAAWSSARSARNGPQCG